MGYARKLAKELVERTLVASGLPKVFRYLHQDRAVILTYHNIIPEGTTPAGDRSLHLSKEGFVAQLDALMRTHRVVSLDELVEDGSDSQDEGVPRAVITFDDAYRGAMRAGLEELASRDLPSTVFVAPGRLGGRSFWWDEVAEVGGGLDPRTRSVLLERLNGQQKEIDDWIVEHFDGLPKLPNHALTVDETELTEAVNSFQITLGSHTWSHAHLPSLFQASCKSVEKELTRSRKWLQENFSSAFRPWLAYPYGATNHEIREMAAKAGYRRTFTIHGGLYKGESSTRESECVPRLNIPAGLSPRAFELRTSGISLTVKT